VYEIWLKSIHIEKNNKTKKISERVKQKQCGNGIALAWLFDVFYEFEKEWVFRTCASIVLFDYKKLIVKQFKNILRILSGLHNTGIKSIRMHLDEYKLQ